MDIYKRTVEIVKKHNCYRNETITEPQYIKEICKYFDDVKDNENIENCLQLLLSLSNDIGIPHYYNLLQKFNKKKLIIDDINLETLAAYANESSLMVSEQLTLHKYQHQVLEHFKVDNENRYILSAPTSFGKTFIIYEIIKKMNYENIVLIFPTISLLSENFDKIMLNGNYSQFKDNYTVHTLSNVSTVNNKNIWIYTPERFLSYLDKNKDAKFDFVFIDEIYKIDNEFIIDIETTGENERDTAFRLALSYACEKSKDVMLAGPYIEFGDKLSETYNPSFDLFVKDNNFTVLNYNEYEIVDKSVTTIKGAREYIVDNQAIKFTNNTHKMYRASIIIENIFTRDQNAIVYCSTKRNTEKYAKILMDEYLQGKSFLRDEKDQEILDMFLEHIERRFGNEWIVLRALKCGIGVHHGLVPKYIQKEIIRLFNKGVLTFILSTTTITEGINTTAKNIVILSDKKGIKALRHFDAKNIAGRAGRFSEHYKGNVIVLDNNFDKTLTEVEDNIKHKNYDINSSKQDVDFLITKDIYMKEKDIERKQYLTNEQTKRGIPDEIVNQFKTISIADKINVFDAIIKVTSDVHMKIRGLISTINQEPMRLDWNGFEAVLSIVNSIVNPNSKLHRIANLEINCRNGSTVSLLTILLSSYLEKGFYGLIEYKVNKQNSDIDSAVRETADFVYNILKYELVKYLGVFDLMYRYVISEKQCISMIETSGISKLLQMLEYNALSDNARIVSDYGVPFSVVKYYESKDLRIKKSFDEYEQHISTIISQIIVE